MSKISIDEARKITEAINDVRKSSKNQWYQYIDVPNGIRLKGYNTWIQRIERDSFVDGSPMDMTVADFKRWLINWIIGTNQ